MDFSTATALVLALSANAALADTVKVGLIADFTGAFATWGPQFQQAIEAYQAIHGKSVKGPDGKEHEIEFLYRDSASGGPDKARQLAEGWCCRITSSSWPASICRQARWPSPTSLARPRFRVDDMNAATA